MSRKAVGAISLTLLALMLIAVVPVGLASASTSISHPKLMVYGTVTKDVYVGRSIFEYKDDQGLSSVLPFERQEKNITIAFHNIIFDKNFENKTVSKGSDVVASPMTLTKEVFVENGQEYIYLKEVNKTALSANTWYPSYTTLSISGEPSVSNDHYLLVSFKVKQTGTNVNESLAAVYFIFKDSGGNERTLGVQVWTRDGTDGYVLAGVDSYVDYGHENEWVTIQLKIQDLLDARGLSWNLVKLVKIQYRLSMKTSSTLDSSTAKVEAFFKHALVVPNKVYIDDGTTDGLLLNGVSGQFPPTAGDVINIYGATAKKIVGVTIPFEYEVPYEAQTDGKNLIIQYTWEYTHPKSPETGDSLTFANTNMTLYGYKDGIYWDKLTFNLQDKLTAIANKKVDSTKGYWTYCLVNGLTEGSAYQLLARVEYTAEEFDALTAAPSFWSDPLGWIMDKLLALIQVVASFLGLSLASKIRGSRRALRRVRMLLSWLVPAPMMMAAPMMPVMVKRGVKLTAKGERVSRKTSSFAALMLIIALFLGVIALYGGIVELPTWVLVAPLVIGYLALLWDATH